MDVPDCCTYFTVKSVACPDKNEGCTRDHWAVVCVTCDKVAIPSWCINNNGLLNPPITEL